MCLVRSQLKFGCLRPPSERRPSFTNRDISLPVGILIKSQKLINRRKNNLSIKEKKKKSLHGLGYLIVHFCVCGSSSIRTHNLPLTEAEISPFLSPNNCKKKN